jgi:crotonobetainyl-CoA:carnitine CoA-transferase CaiB-like acyl-CoA transferase
MYHSGDSDQEPLRNALNQSFYVAGINAAVATSAALFQRMFTGQGQAIDVSTVECLASHLVQAVPYYSYMGAIKGRRPVRGSGFEELMPARDGYVIPSVQGSQPWSTVADLIDVPELQDERYASGSGRIEFGEEIYDLLIQGLAQWDRKALHQASGERRLVFGMAQDAGDLHDCPHLQEREFFRTVSHPVAEEAKYPGMGPRLSGVDYQVSRHAPLLGQHNREIYGDELGCSDSELTQLRALGAI